MPGRQNYALKRYVCLRLQGFVNFVGLSSSVPLSDGNVKQCNRAVPWPSRRNSLIEPSSAPAAASASLSSCAKHRTALPCPCITCTPRLSAPCFVYVKMARNQLRRCAGSAVSDERRWTRSFYFHFKNGWSPGALTATDRDFEADHTLTAALLSPLRSKPPPLLLKQAQVGLPPPLASTANSLRGCIVGRWYTAEQHSTGFCC